MIGPDRFARFTAEAAVPEQVPPYVCAVAGSKPRLVGSCVGYVSEESMVLVGYPLHDPLNIGAMADAVEQALKTPGLGRLTVIGPVRPPQAPASVRERRDEYFALTLPPSPSPKLRNLLRRAGRELTLDRGRVLLDDHMALAQRYLDERALEAGTRHIFRQMGNYLEASAGALVVSARRSDGKLAAFAIGEFGSLSTAFFMFCFRDPALAPPGSADLTLSELLEEAHERGQTRMNLGLGINDSIRFFKCKWGGTPFLPYVEVSWEPGSLSVFSKVRGMLWRKRS